ncbi:hypothetical protein [Nannocystis radixulma]|uniref:Uncharacterized protein n=1 Tax=Nannocystis radixulma TaxID=2995305 RepID=A0ABT5AZU2_9BACT|nr:hypothetical protein [Nannocystis radixulma]MDC0666809.1 hypothetical protein [Nannocystis radixulma]
MSAVLAATLAACEGPDPAASSFALPPTASPAPDSTGDEPGTSTGTTGTSEPVPEDSSTSSTGEPSTTLPLQDLGMPDLGDLHPVGCKGKIDFLFVISRYGLMESKQARLIEAFPHFIETIESKFADFDYHIMVVDGDETWGSQVCNADCSPTGCPYPEYPCDAVASISTCDTTMGAGTVFPAGKAASNVDCGIVGGRRYITRDQPNPVDTFACLAQVGLTGDDRLGEAVTAAMAPEINDVSGCNGGFLRDDALLMITFIANTTDQFSAGKPKEWAETITAAKHGDANSVVMFSIQEPECNPWDRVCDLVKYYFPYHHIADEDDYRPAFEVATDLVEEACSAFIPQ